MENECYSLKFLTEGNYAVLKNDICVGTISINSERWQYLSNSTILATDILRELVKQAYEQEKSDA